MRYMADTLDIRSSAGRRMLMQCQMLHDTDEINRAYLKLHEFYDRLIAAPEAKVIRRTLETKLRGLKECSAAINRLSAGDDGDEVVFFEIKSLSLLCREVKPLLEQVGITSVTLPDTVPVIELLDPDATGTASFYIYDSYEAELGRIRRLMRDSSEDKDRLLAESRSIEGRVCHQLSKAIMPYAGMLRNAFDTLAEIDILLAKAAQIATLRLTFPQLSETAQTEYKGLFHPQIRAQVEHAGRTYQPVNISLGSIPTTVIGANMGGKTVLLRSVALSQLLFQFGFGIPAAQASICPVEQVRLRIGDAESILGGLSSFASEVTAISETICEVRSGKRTLVLLDEPARTTNPIEGAALVSSLVNLLGGANAQSIVTTHYNLPNARSRRLKVRGLTDEGMDYSLTEVAAGEVPHEALAVAEMLGIDKEWIDGAQKLLDKD